jgi:hypothetical protein
MIIGCDLHPRYQQIAMVDTDTGELVERRLEHESGEARAFYTGLKGNPSCTLRRACPERSRRGGIPHGRNHRASPDFFITFFSYRHHRPAPSIGANITRPCTIEKFDRLQRRTQFPATFFTALCFENTSKEDAQAGTIFENPIGFPNEDPRLFSWPKVALGTCGFDNTWQRRARPQVSAKSQDVTLSPIV